VIEVEAHITGIVWKVDCKVGDVIEEGDTVITLESMKMEMPVEEGQPVDEGDVLVVLE
jgi:acetyl-CoA carboxylase biotin carboxyl carrier protein